MSTANKTQTMIPEMEDDLEGRYEAIAEIIVNGASRQDAIALSMRRWGISRRTAEVYVQTVRKRLAGEAATTDRLFYLHLSQLQRDRMVGLVLRYTTRKDADYNPQVMQSLSTMITAVRGLLDSRDRTAAEIHELVQERLERAARTTAGTAPEHACGVNDDEASDSTNGNGAPHHPPAPAQPAQTEPRFDPRRKRKARAAESPTPLHAEEAIACTIPASNCSKPQRSPDLGTPRESSPVEDVGCASCATG